MSPNNANTILTPLLACHCVCCAGNTSAILVASDAEAADKTARQLQSAKYGLVWTQFNDLSSFYYDRWDTPSGGAGGALIAGTLLHTGTFEDV